jgi:hypothetical protein
VMLDFLLRGGGGRRQVRISYDNMICEPGGKPRTKIVYIQLEKNHLHTQKLRDTAISSFETGSHLFL